MKGFVRIFLGLALALAALVQAGTGPAAATEPSAKLKGLQEEGARLYKAGAYPEALEAAKRTLAQTIAEFGKDSEQASIQTYGAGLAAEAAGDYPEAERQYVECLRVRRNVYGPESAGAAMVLERLGHAERKNGKLGDAEERFLHEIKIFRDLRLGEHSISATAYSGLGDVNLARGDFKTALTHYRKAVTQLTSQRSQQALARSVEENQIREHRDIFIGLGRAAAGLRNRTGVDEKALMEESFSAGQRAWATSAAAALAKMTARLKAGETELGRAVRHLDGLNERILELNQIDMAALAARSELQRKDAAYSKVMDDFRAASIEQSKVNAPNVKRQSELIERLSSAGESDRQAISKELGELSQQAAKGAGEINRLSQELKAADQRLPGYAEFEAARKARLDESQRLEQELTAARADVVRRFPDYLSLADPAPLPVAETQRLLKQDEALVAILTGPDSSLVWTVTPEGSDWAEAPASDAALAIEVKALRAALEPQPDGSAPAPFDLARSNRLYELLLGRFANTLAGKKHLMFVATGPLSSLPFQVLVTEPPRAGLSGADALKEAKWLVRTHALSVLPSVQSLSALRKLASAGVAVKPYFGIGDPALGGGAFDSGNSRGTAKAKVTLAALYRGGGRASLPILQTLPPLPETADELRRVARTLGATESNIVLGQAATKQNLMSTALQDYRVLHFATHGLVAGELSGLLEPALVLSLPPQSTSAEDALLTASEVATLQLNADWAVLSACNTASGDKTGADALSGLARAFFFAGTRALLVSHWAVDSESAVALTTRTFGYLAKAPQMRRAEAFQKAMLTLIEEGHPPSHWAPFVIVGEGGAVVRKNGA
jgi:CHAT domain-containing protein